MSAKAKISKIASLWYATSIATSAAVYFGVRTATVTGTAFSLAISLGFLFVVHRLLLGGSSLMRKLALVYNALGMVFAGLGVFASLLSIGSSPLRSVFGVILMGWNVVLYVRSFSTLKDSDVKRVFA